MRELQEDNPAPSPLNQVASVSCCQDLGAGDSGRADEGGLQSHVDAPAPSTKGKADFSGGGFTVRTEGLFRLHRGRLASAGPEGCVAMEMGDTFVMSCLFPDGHLRAVETSDSPFLRISIVQTVAYVRVLLAPLFSTQMTFVQCVCVCVSVIMMGRALWLFAFPFFVANHGAFL